jgi:hypothetical protein
MVRVLCKYIFCCWTLPNCFCCTTGCLEPTKCFRVIPREALTTLLFCDQKFTVDDVIRALDPIYGYINNEDTSICGQQMILSICHETNDRCGVLVDVLRDRCVSNNDFLIDFVWCTTGSKFISQPAFTITIEFSYKESKDPDSLPVAHTCAHTLKFPGLAYDGNRETFEQKLDYFIEHAKCAGFDMN